MNSSPAQTPHHVADAEVLSQDAGDIGQHEIAHEMTVRIVHVFEAIDVHDQQGAPLASRKRIQLLPDAQTSGLGIQQAREAIAFGARHELVFLPPFFVDDLDFAHRMRHAPRRVLHRIHRHAQPMLDAVRIGHPHFFDAMLFAAEEFGERTLALLVKSPAGVVALEGERLAEPLLAFPRHRDDQPFPCGNRTRRSCRRTARTTAGAS